VATLTVAEHDIDGGTSWALARSEATRVGHIMKRHFKSPTLSGGVVELIERRKFNDLRMKRAAAAPTAR
jgi:hypothetical protein